MTMDGNITQTKFHRMQNEGAIFLWMRDWNKKQHL